MKFICKTLLFFFRWITHFKVLSNALKRTDKKNEINSSHLQNLPNSMHPNWMCTSICIDKKEIYIMMKETDWKCIRCEPLFFPRRNDETTNLHANMRNWNIPDQRLAIWHLSMFQWKFQWHDRYNCIFASNPISVCSGSRCCIIWFRCQFFRQPPHSPNREFQLHFFPVHFSHAFIFLRSWAISFFLRTENSMSICVNRN